MKTKLKIIVLLLCVWIECVSQTPACSTNVINPVLKKNIKVFSSNQVDYSAFICNGKVGQSFISNVPYINEVKLYFQPESSNKAYSIALYYYGNPSSPRNFGRKLIEQSFTVQSSTTDITQTISFSPAIYVKQGSYYYLEITPTAGNNVKSFLSNKDVYPDCGIYKQDINYPLQDLKIDIMGGFPSKAYDALPITNLNYVEPPNHWAIQSYSFGQTFIATTSLLKSIGLATGGYTPPKNKIEARIYEIEEVSQTINYKKQIGQACTKPILAWGKTLFDWEAENLATPYLEVGKKYYVEFTNPEDIYLEVIGWNEDIYTQGNAYINGFKRENGQDLSIEIKGIEPNVVDEKVYAVQTSPYDQSWNTNALKIGQVFKATTHYLTSVTANSCLLNANLNFNLYEYSGATTNPKGKLIYTKNNVPISYCGITQIYFDQPIWVKFGTDYYIEFSNSIGTNTINMYGSRAANYDYTTYKRKYPYGYTLMTNGGAYSQINEGRLNSTITGFCGGQKFMGYGFGINAEGIERNPTNGDPSNDYFCNALKDYEDIGAYWSRSQLVLTTDVTNSDRIDAYLNKTEARNAGGVVVILKPGLGTDDDKYYWNVDDFDSTGLLERSRKTFYRDAFEMAEKAKILAERYKGYHIIWEVLNEAGGSTISMNQYVELLKIVGNAMRSVDPNVWLGAGSIPYLYYTDSDLQIENEMGNFVDFYFYHPYFEPTPERNILNWTTSRRLKFTQKSTNNKKPTLFSSEYGIYKDSCDVSQGVKSEYYIYNVKETGSNVQISTTQKVGQTFRIHSESSINYIVLNTGFNENFSDLYCTLYKYSGNINSPAGTMLCSLQVSNLHSQNGMAFFDFKTISPLLTNFGQYFYVEFYRQGGVNQFSYYYSTQNVYNHSSSHVIEDWYSYNLNSDNIFNGQAYWKRSTDVASIPIDHGTGVTFDLNITIGNGSSSGDFLSLPKLPTMSSIESDLESLRAIQIARHILTQMKEGIPGSLIYKTLYSRTFDEYGVLQKNGLYGIFEGLKPDGNFYDPPRPKKKPTYAMGNLYESFKNAHNTPRFSIEIIGADDIVHSVFREDDTDGALIIALWANIPVSNTTTKTVTVKVNSSFYSNKTVTKLENIANMNPGSSTITNGITNTSNYISISNVTIGANPIILKIK